MIRLEGNLPIDVGHVELSGSFDIIPHYPIIACDHSIIPCSTEIRELQFEWLVEFHADIDTICTDLI